jgi:hypothetical protein
MKKLGEKAEEMEVEDEWEERKKAKRRRRDLINQRLKLWKYYY